MAPNWYYHSGSKLTREKWQRKSAPYYSNVQQRILTIGCFIVKSRTLVAERGNLGLSRVLQSTYSTNTRRLDWILFMLKPILFLKRFLRLKDIAIIILFMSRYQHIYSWPSLATPPNSSLLSADSLGNISYRHRAAVCRFELDVLLFTRPCEGVHRSISLMSSSLLLPAVSHVSGSSNFDSFRDGWVVGGRIAAALRSAFSSICSILLAAFLCNWRQTFSPSAELASMWCINIAVPTRSLLGRNCTLFYWSGLTCIWPKVYRSLSMALLSRVNVCLGWWDTAPKVGELVN